MTGILITGVGGPLGQAIIKAARAAKVPLRLIGTDRHELSVGLQWVDAGHILPDCARREAYLEAMLRVCRDEGVQAILPGSDSELEILAGHADAIRSETGATVIASAPRILDIALDKLETCRFLEAAGLRFPRYASLNDAESVEGLVRDVGFPLLAKPRRGSGSRNVFRLCSWDDVQSLSLFSTEFVLQEYLAPDDEEYTVAVFTKRSGEQGGCIVMRRDLAAGVTYRAWVTHDDAIEGEARAVAAALHPFGPCNIQMRRTQKGPVTFEINPRFSSSTGMRAHFGFNEVEMAIRNLVLDEDLPKPAIRDGIALRYWEECYRFPEGTTEDTEDAARSL